MKRSEFLFALCTAGHTSAVQTSTEEARKEAKLPENSLGTVDPIDVAIDALRQPEPGDWHPRQHVRLQMHIEAAWEFYEKNVDDTGKLRGRLN